MINNNKKKIKVQPVRNVNDRKIGKEKTSILSQLFYFIFIFRRRRNTNASQSGAETEERM